MSLHVELVSPEGVILISEADMVLARTTDGDIAFQPGHVSFVGNLCPGMVKVNASDGAVHYLAVHGGFVEIASDRISILSDIAEVASEIDISRASAALERAKAVSKEESGDSKAAAAAMRRAEVRLAVAAAGAGAEHVPGS